MFGRIVFGLIGIPLGVLIILKTRYIVEQITGPIGWAENLFGSFGSGTYSFFRLAGFAIVVASLMVMLGVANWIYEGIVTSLMGVSAF